MTLQYRPEIDGLRTVAVMSVLVYHAQFEINDAKLLPGGFLGVDIFFVISGFLITSLIHQEWTRTGRFSILDFYERRARRLLPALFVVIIASWPFAWFILMPTAMVDFVKSQLASIFFLSNMYFWDTAMTYGGRSGALEPFLHTWSLAVEEQFYLIFPVVYLWLLRRVSGSVALLRIFLTAIVLGLLGAQYMSQNDWQLSFFWLPSRIWELMAGAALAHVMIRNPVFGHNEWRCRLLPLLGLSLILVSMWHMTPDFHHPGFATIGAVLGTVLVIWFANSRDPLTQVLSSRGCVAIGLISYSLYLWHYPVFAFGRHLQHDPGLASKAVWFALSLIMAFLSYRFVEAPFRDRVRLPRPRLIGSLAGATLATVAFATVMLSADGLRERFPKLIALYGVNEFDNDGLRDQTREPSNRLAKAAGYGPVDFAGPTEFEMHHQAFSDDPATHKVLFVGNSHSLDMFNVFNQSADLFPEMEFARFGMAAKLPGDQVEQLRAAPNFWSADTIAISFRYHAAFPNMQGFMDMLSATNKQLVVMLNTVEFETIDGFTVFDWYLQKSNEPFSIKAMNAFAHQHRDTLRNPGLNAPLRAFAAEADAIVLDRADYICAPGTKACTVVTADGHKAHWDYGHYTLEGAAYFGRVIAETGWFAVTPPDRSVTLAASRNTAPGH